MTRTDLLQCRRVVVKVGSSSISGENQDNIATLVRQLATLVHNRVEVVLVSSGAIATGVPLLNLGERPDDLATQQAAAAVGQSVLVHSYQQALQQFEIVGAQVLLTAGDLENPVHRQNAQQAMERLLALSVLPIVNENDTVATHEIRFGDNDHLAALVAQLLQADALVLLSDIDALYTKPPSQAGAERIATVSAGENLDHIDIGASGTGWGTGGAVTKVAAASLACASGTGVYLAHINDFAQLLTGEPVGTWFEPVTVS